MKPPVRAPRMVANAITKKKAIVTSSALAFRLFLRYGGPQSSNPMSRNITFVKARETPL